MLSIQSFSVLPAINSGSSSIIEVSFHQFVITGVLTSIALAFDINDYISSISANSVLEIAISRSGNKPKVITQDKRSASAI